MPPAKIDPKLKKNLKGLKKCKKEKPGFFCFVGEDKDGKLMVDVRKPIKPGDKCVKEAKKEVDCEKMVIGKCHAHEDGKQTVFLTKKPAPKPLRTWIIEISRKAGSPVVPFFDIDKKTDKEDAAEEAARAKEPVVEDEDDEAEDAADAATPEQGEAADAKKADDGVLQDKDLGTWQTAREEACKKLRLLGREVARTKHASAGPVLAEIDSIIKKLPLVPKRTDIDSLIKLIQTDPTIKAAEASPKHFFDLDITTGLVSSLESLRS
jgi:hypothetical protein